jgi:hypothetical protein
LGGDLSYLTRRSSHSEHTMSSSVVHFRAQTSSESCVMRFWFLRRRTKRNMNWWLQEFRYSTPQGGSQPWRGSIGLWTAIHERPSLEFGKIMGEVCDEEEECRVQEGEYLYLTGRLSAARRVLKRAISFWIYITVVRRPEDLGMLPRTQLIREWISLFTCVHFSSVVTIREPKEHG